MKSVIVKNVQIQFDIENSDSDIDAAYNVLDRINSVLQEQMPEVSPQLFVNSIDNTDFEFAELKDEE